MQGRATGSANSSRLEGHNEWPTTASYQFAKHWQGQQDSNPRPSVLETDALPAELYPHSKASAYSYYIGQFS